MKIKASALEYMEVFFPKLFAHLDVENFELDDTNYVSKNFKEYFSDVVYRTYLKETQTKTTSKKKKKAMAIVLLFEHKKSISSYFLLFLQLLEYIVFIWREDWQNGKKPSIIVPIVIYQGKRGLKPKQLHDIFEGVSEDILQYVPNLRFHLTNIHGIDDKNLLMLEEKNLLRTLFLAYTYNEKQDKIKDMLIEIFKFIKHNPENMHFFQIFFEFISKEAYLSDDKMSELLEHYLSPKIKEGVMTTYQVWVNKGRQEGKEEGLLEGIEKGERRKARLNVLRGKSRGATADFLAYQAELPLAEVTKLFEGYEEVYKFWVNKNKKGTLKVTQLTDDEVQYLLNLFSKTQN